MISRHTGTNTEKYIADWVHTKWLVLSSFFFTVPGMYAYINKLHSYSVLLFFTSLISANYWRKATYSWRRNMDLMFAKISFVVFASSGVLYVRKLHYVIPGYTGLLGLLYCYYLSGKLLELKKDNWYKYHFVFHAIMTYEQIIIIDSILKKGIEI
jgi:hypothetical protein